MWDSVYLGNTLMQYIYFFATIALSVLAGKVVAWVFENVAVKLAAKTKTETDNLMIELMKKPLIFLVFIIGLYIAQGFLLMGDRFSEFYSNVLGILLTLNAAWFVMNFGDAILVHYIKPWASKTESELDDTIVPLLRKLFKFIVISITIIMIIDNFGYDVSSLVAGLGLGGLAFALAAKDILGNFFGGIAIVTDRPFKLGDRIRLDEKNDGWVRDIGLRTTRIETLDGTILTIPNAKLVDSILENVSAENARKIKMTIGVEYGTSHAKMKKAKKIIEDVVKKNKDTKDNSIVSFTDFAESSLNFLVIYWIKDLDNILSVKHEINMEIKKQFEKSGIGFPFPTRTVYLKK